MHPNTMGSSVHFLLVQESEISQYTVAKNNQSKFGQRQTLDLASANS